ncbi:MAG: hypothetical protein ACI391_09025, partial [Muribaculaceae bacterium]
MKLLLKLCVLGAAVLAGSILHEASGATHPRHATRAMRYNPSAVASRPVEGRLSVKTSHANEVLDVTSTSSHQTAATTSGSRMCQAPMKEVSQGEVTLWGNVIFADSWDENAEYLEGIYTFPAQNNTTLTPLYVDSELYANGGGVLVGNVFKYVSYYTYADGEICYATYYEFDTTTGEYLKYEDLKPSQYGVIANIITHDPITDKYYGIFPSETSSGTDFGYVDYSTMTKTVIAQADQFFVAMAANSKGEIYAINEYGDFFKVDKTTGKSEYYGETGVYPARYLQSMAFDLATDRLYWASQLANGKAWLCEVDTEYGEITKISDFPDNEEIVCLCVPRAAALSGAPAAVEELQVITDKASTTVGVEFTMPSSTYGGESLSGELQYKVQANNELLAEGKANAGEKVSLSIEVSTGEVKIDVIAINEVGDGEAQSVKTWVGYDVPAAVSNVVFTIDEQAGTSILTWEPSEGGIHNGYIEEITYEVTRYPDAVVVATGLTSTSWQESKPTGAIKTYSYEVVAVNGDQRS